MKKHSVCCLIGLCLQFSEACLPGKELGTIQRRWITCFLSQSQWQSRVLIQNPSFPTLSSTQHRQLKTVAQCSLEQCFPIWPYMQSLNSSNKACPTDAFAHFFNKWLWDNFFLMETKGRKGKVKIPEHIWNFYSLFVQYSIYLDES